MTERRPTIAGERLPTLSAEPPTVGEVIERIDRGWAEFRALVGQYPPERLDEAIGKSWTRKQMLAHVAAWHEQTTERLLRFAQRGAPQQLAQDVDAFNARVARVAIGRTTGEVLGALDSSFRRLRRQVELLEDEHLATHDGWVISVIAANTFDHYDEHDADMELPAAETSGQR